MSVTRLLVLGVVRLVQPAHGYLVRRELLSWQAQEWANLNPGSVYNALRSMTRDGLLVEHQAGPGTGAEGSGRGGPATRATYELTSDGEAEFLGLLRDALWRPHPFEPARLAAGLSFWSALSREEVVGALSARRAALAADLPLLDHMTATITTLPSKPDHVAEHFRLQQAMIAGELQWLDAALGRIRDGAYWFAGEPELDDTGRRRDGMDCPVVVVLPTGDPPA